MNNEPVIHLVTFSDAQSYISYLSDDLARLGVSLQVSGFGTAGYTMPEAGTPQVVLLTPEAIYQRACVLRFLEFHQLTESFRNVYFIVADVPATNGLPLLHPGRVSQVIQAMNHWQEAYLKRQVDAEGQHEEPAMMEQLEQINASIGDVVRDIRTALHQSFTEMVQERYIKLLQFLQLSLDESHEGTVQTPLNLADYFEELKIHASEDSDREQSSEKHEPDRVMHPESPQEEPELLTLDQILSGKGDEVEDTIDVEESGSSSFRIGPSDLPGASIFDDDDWKVFQKAQDASDNDSEKEETDQEPRPDAEKKPLTESDLNLYRRLARLYAGKNDLKRALKMIRKAVKKGDRSIETEVIYAKILLKAGKRRRALDQWLQSCKKDPMQFNAATAAIFGLPDSAVSLIEKGFEKKTVLRNDTVLITGATSGIGEAVAKSFAREGYKVIVTGRREKRLLALQAELERLYHARVLPLTMDIRNRAEVEEAIKQLPEAWSHIHVLVNNAGLAKGLSSIYEGNPDDWDLMIDTNLKGLLYLTRALSPGMVARGRGHIINIGSVSGKEVYPAGNVYCATKFAVDGLTRAMRLDLFQKNIRVSAVSPGHVETEFALVRFDGDRDKADIYSDFRPLSPEDVAEVVLFVATRPERVNIQDVLMFSSQQAGAVFIDRSGRKV